MKVLLKLTVTLFSLAVLRMSGRKVKPVGMYTRTASSTSLSPSLHRLLYLNIVNANFFPG